MKILCAEVELPAKDLHVDLDYYTKQLGFRLETIHPSDDPAVAVLSGHGLRLRLDKNSSAEPGALHLMLDPDGDDIDIQPGEYDATNGTRIVMQMQETTAVIPVTRHSYQVRRLQDSDPWVIGRAGMMYRDLIDDRLGGSIIASHIRIPDGGPVPDMMHYHTIGFQLIYCLSGWVRLVYEDQGPPFILNAGDCVTQPPRIRHRVLESSDNLEVLEIGVPAHHMTTIDHDLELPTENYNPQREFDGQVFCHHRLKEANWQPCQQGALNGRDTGIATATRGLAAVDVFRTDQSANEETGGTIAIKGSSDIHFMLVSNGEVTVDPESTESTESSRLAGGDALVLPPGMTINLSGYSRNFEFIQVCIK